MKKLFYRLTGGRPMKKVCYAFTDVGNNRAVHYYVDRLGRSWLAQGAWASFRVKPITPIAK